MTSRSLPPPLSGNLYRRRVVTATAGALLVSRGAAIGLDVPHPLFLFADRVEE